MGDGNTAGDAFGANARVQALRVSSGADGGRQIELEHVTFDDVEGAIGDVALRADTLEIDGLQTRIGHVQSIAESAHVAAATLATADRNLRFQCQRIGFPRGFSFTHGAELFAPHASLEDVAFAVDDVRALFARPGAGETAGEGDTEANAGASGRRGPTDYRFLDALRGQLDIDLVVDFSLPWVGRRRGTHYLRVPIEDGTIDFEALESDVHWLENLFLDIEVVDDKLVLERDLPLVPFAGKALIWWKLQPEDVPLAQYRRVHLRNLLAWELPPRKPRAGGEDRDKGKYGLHEVSLDNCALTLETARPAQFDLPGGALVQIGGDDQTGMTGLQLAGQLRYQRGETPSPTAITGRVDSLDVTLKDLRLGAVAVSADRLHIGDLEDVKLRFEGFRPRRLTGKIARLAATNLRIQVPHIGN